MSSRSSRGERKELKQKGLKLTESFQHLVAFVQNKVLDLRAVQSLVLGQSQHTTRGSNGNVGTSVLVLELLNVARDGRSTVKDLSSDVGHEFRETLELVLDLVGEFSSVAENNDAGLAIDWLAARQRDFEQEMGHLHLLQRGKDEDGSLTHTRFGLTQNIGTKDSLGNTLLLDCGMP